MREESDQQFWTAFHQTLALDSTAQLAQLDQALTRSLDLISANLAGELSDEQSLHHAVSTLFRSPLFLNHSQRVTNSIILILIDPSTPLSSIFVACLVLLLNGFENSSFFRTLRTINLSALSLTNSSSPISHPNPPAELSQLIPVLLAIGTRVGLVPSSSISSLSNHFHSNDRYADDPSDCSSPSLSNERYAERKLGPLISGLLYELCRVQKLKDETLELFSEQLIDNLFQLVELTRDQEDETFNYNLIKLIIALNEQFMLAGLNHQPQKQTPHASRHHRRRSHHASDVENNIIIRTMKRRLDESKTFGENLIFILNRASHSTSEGLCVSLLILKISTYLPDESDDLRHTYLRVLHPLLTQTQLRSYPYKREEIRHALMSHIKYAHLQDINPTTKRLVDRNLQSDWCLELEKAAVSSLNSLDSVQFSCEPIRSLSADTLGSHLSGGGSITEVITSNTESLPILRPSSSTVTDVSHQLSPPSPSAAPQSPRFTMPNPPEGVSHPLRSPVVLKSNSSSQTFVQVIVANSNDCFEESQLNHTILSIESSSSGAINRPASIVSAHSNSPSSNTSQRPSSSCSMSHSPARRPAPKPPTSKRKGQLGPHLSPVPDSIGPSSTEISVARYSVMGAPADTDQDGPETARRASMPSGEYRPRPLKHDKQVRRAAPSPPLPLSPAQPDEGKLHTTRRRKAPLPPTEPFSKLRSSKSSGHLSPPSSDSLPRSPGWKPRPGRVVSISSDNTNYAHPADKATSNPFGE
ncbi:hypothetical protein PCANC_01525 [Puccinia coronata f. sp. avenae]|uniref:SPIN90/Ldb17 leucine-rich domain-containing protein n=1 Tax=Puccinia coronata f. sp. avenae TaxID=200324 RepID=A0A2N5W2R4_9BASI|nr:hypothetical protein PCANC_01525 [Puccinia coronata f. sp. avenae]